MDGTDLTGRTALVTGASRRLGREIAIRLAVAGARVVAVARDPEGLAAAVEAMPGEVSALPVDLADVDAIAGAVSGVGDVDVLVNAAAVMSARRSKTLEVPLDAWRSVRAVDLDAPFALVSAFVPGMVERRWDAWST